MSRTREGEMNFFVGFVSSIPLPWAWVCFWVAALAILWALTFGRREASSALWGLIVTCAYVWLVLAAAEHLILAGAR